MNLFQLFGEIAIDNSKANEQIDKTSNGAKKLASTMKGAFATAGKVAVKAGKVIATGIAAGTAAMGKLVKSALDGYASYEQLEGGVKKLFGEDAQKLVMAYAQNAYKTAGLSANEYMETVTSFSASLIAGLGNDTIAAAKYADIAITDMADNANTFGTSMEDVQNAYKGFSKGNYTMLDNLKLGYGGTQKEMERLLKDAQAIQKLAGNNVKYDISNFSDIIAAIHVIQEKQGIAGTTAKEAATTISGSIGMVKGAWENLLSGLGDENQDVGQLVDNLTDSVLTAADNIVPRLQTMAPRLVAAVKTLVSTLAPQLPGIINSVLPAMIEAATTLIGGLADVLPDLLGAIIDVLPNIIKQIGGALQKLFPSLLKTFKTLIGKIDFKGLGQAIGNGLKSVVTNLPRILSDIGNAISWGWKNICYPTIQGLFKAVFGVELPEWGKLKDKIIEDWNGIKEGVRTALKVAWSLLPPGVQQAIRDIRNWWSKVTSKLNLNVRYNVVKNAVPAAIEDALNPDAPKGSLTTPTVSGMRGIEIINSIINPFAHADGAIFSKPTLFDTASGYHLVGEAGAEAVAPISVLQGYVKSAVNEVVGNSMERKLDQMLTALQEGFGGMNQQIVLDTGVLVGSTAGMMDKRLGRMAVRKGRNA